MEDNSNRFKYIESVLLLCSRFVLQICGKESGYPEGVVLYHRVQVYTGREYPNL